MFWEFSLHLRTIRQPLRVFRRNLGPHCSPHPGDGTTRSDGLQAKSIGGF